MKKEPGEVFALGTGVGVAIGVSIGTAIGVITDNIGLWLPLGVAVGGGFGSLAMAFSRHNVSDEADQDSEISDNEERK